jgi:enoyl-CoA hydratase
VSSSELEVSRPSEHVALVTLNRPKRLDALTDSMVDGFRDALSSIGAVTSVRAVVDTGAARGFCAGLDLDEAAALPGLGAVEFYRAQERWASTLAALTTAMEVENRSQVPAAQSQDMVEALEAFRAKRPPQFTAS